MHTYLSIFELEPVSGNCQAQVSESSARFDYYAYRMCILGLCTAAMC